jgi:hypothetical protein
MQCKHISGRTFCATLCLPPPSLDSIYYHHHDNPAHESIRAMASYIPNDPGQHHYIPFPLYWVDPSLSIMVPYQTSAPCRPTDQTPRHPASSVFCIGTEHESFALVLSYVSNAYSHRYSPPWVQDCRCVRGSSGGVAENVILRPRGLGRTLPWFFGWSVAGFRSSLKGDMGW